MKKTVLAISLCLVMIVSLVGTVSAITNNYVNDFDHPYVGMIVFYDSSGSFIWRCSGSLISPTKMVTAGHCADIAEGAASARVWFQQDVGSHLDAVLGYDPVTGYASFCAPGTEGVTCATASHIYNYGFANFAGFPNTHDVGLVILDQPITVSEYAQLPTAGLLDNLDTMRGTQDTIFTISGYGLSYEPNAKSPLGNLSFRIRLEANSTLVNLGKGYNDVYNLQTQGNGDSRGGTCSGDSGGPVLLGNFDSNTIVAVTSFGKNSMCRGTDFSYRLDRQEVLDWINGGYLQ